LVRLPQGTTALLTNADRDLATHRHRIVSAGDSADEIRGAKATL
jgi:hypothetical protein